MRVSKGGVEIKGKTKNRSKVLVNRPFFNLYAMTNGKRALIPGRNLNNYVKNRWRIEMSKVEREFESKAEIPFETGAKITADLDKKESFIWFQR